jgi:S-adenosylmethionine:tRNA ribosyltransferase-isomerase
MQFSRSAYSYELPHDLIAENAISPHHNAKIMIVEKESGNILSEDIFWNLDTYINEESVIFFNNSKVLPSRIPLENTTSVRITGKTHTIENGEIFFLKKRTENTFEALVRPGKKFGVGTEIYIGKYALTVIESIPEWRVFSITWGTIIDFLTEYGKLPLPPYIEYSKEKEEAYQTVFAQKYGSVAAPTASLHFTKELLEKLKNTKKYITLHVWLGTFKWIDTNDIREYQIHEETVEIDGEIFTKIAEYKKNNRAIIAVGTTVCRTLESLPSLWASFEREEKELWDQETQTFWNKQEKKAKENTWIRNKEIEKESQIIRFGTSIYITPGFEFCIIDDLITNFHLPESSLLVLVNSILPEWKIMELYQYAIKKLYRFYSFGDGMYIRSKQEKKQVSFLASKKESV